MNPVNPRFAANRVHYFMTSHRDTASVPPHRRIIAAATTLTPTSSAQPEKIKENWRPHIDGLRAVSVLAVLFYHSGLVSGGFVGVDIFFVISGFLISGMIYADIRAHAKFRIADFYERRARRILPVFLVVTAASLIAGYFFFLPDEFALLGKAAVYASGFAANVFSYQQTGYFDGEASNYPLLHYWSLGVEEQFYIVFPLIVLAAQKLTPRLIGPVIALIAAASFASAEISLRTYPTAAFYFTPQRAWELMVGCLLALPGFPYIRLRLLREGAGAGGVALIVFAAFSYDDTTVFPGLADAVPVAGAALIIWGCEGFKTFTGAILSLPLLRAIGLWSYSIYMIHWPVIVFTKTIWPNQSPTLTVVILIACIALGWFSYQFVETPFRRPKQPCGRRVLSRSGVFQISFVSLLIIGGLGLTIEAQDGLAERMPKEVRQVLAYNHYDFAPLYRNGKCFLVIPAEWRDLSADCFPSGRPSALLWGDSHAAHFYAALRDRFPNVAVVQTTLSSCPPIVGMWRPKIPNCKSFNQSVLDWIVKNRPDIVILSAGWPRDRKSASSLDGTIQPLTASRVPAIIFGETPNYRDPVPSILARRMLRGDRSTLAKDEYTADTISLDEYMKDRFGHVRGVRYISFQDAFCTGGQCPLTTESGVPIYWDYDHFTREGARLTLKHFFADRDLLVTANRSEESAGGRHP
jgi:peptidoglycan/LPS O-acetylase OafA/YrhL